MDVYTVLYWHRDHYAEVIGAAANADIAKALALEYVQASDDYLLGWPAPYRSYENVWPWAHDTDQDRYTIGDIDGGAFVIQRFPIVTGTDQNGGTA